MTSRTPRWGLGGSEGGGCTPTPTPPPKSRLWRRAHQVGLQPASQSASHGDIDSRGMETRACVLTRAARLLRGTATRNRFAAVI